MLMEYLLSDYAIISVVLPWFMAIWWFTTEGYKNPPGPRVLFSWMAAALISYQSATWEITTDTISLHIVDNFTLYLLFALYTREKITPGAAFSLSFLGLWMVDMVYASSLVPTLASWNTFYMGVGGAGIKDGLIIFPTTAAAMVHYVVWRQKLMK